jgi:hypothetical protein
MGRKQGSDVGCRSKAKLLSELPEFMRRRPVLL